MNQKNIQEIKEIVEEKWYYIFSSQNFWDNYAESIIDFSKSFWAPVEQNEKWVFHVDLTPEKWFWIDHPWKWTNGLWLHIDWFFKEIKLRPDYVALLCVNSWLWWETILCNISKSIEDLKNEIGEEKVQKILETKIKPHERGIQFWDTIFDIYQKFNWKIFTWNLLEEYKSKKYYTICDNMDKNILLKPLQNILDKNTFSLPQFKKWEIIIINNTTFLHWRKKIKSKDRHLVRVQIKNNLLNN